jgi:hypothetical protein
MPEITEAHQALLEALKEPRHIKDALYASSPYVLRKAFDADPGIRELLRAGPGLATAVAEKLEAEPALDEISMCAYFYLLEHTASRDAIARVLDTRTRARLRKPSPFLSQFSTRAILRAHRTGLRAPIESYTLAEVVDAVDRVR